MIAYFSFLDSNSELGQLQVIILQLFAGSVFLFGIGCQSAIKLPFSVDQIKPK